MLKQNFIVPLTLLFCLFSLQIFSLNRENISSKKNHINSLNKQKTHILKAEVDSGMDSAENRQIGLSGKKKGWFFFVIFGLFGGMAIFLFGMEKMSSGLKELAGDRMKALIGKLTNNRLMGVAIGTIVTAGIQSSSATTVMLVSFVQSGLMTLSQTLGVILGADIGTTITVQLIAFRVTDYSLLLVAVGFFLTMTSKEGLKFYGEIILGLGFVFFGMDIMGKSVIPLRTFEPFIQILITLKNPIVGIAFGAVFTAIIQSSSAFTGILLALSMQGVLNLDTAVPPLLGANIGTCITAIIASLNTKAEAKRVAAAHTLFKVLGVMLVVGFLPEFIHFIKWITPGAGDFSHLPQTIDPSIPRQLANAHTVFNVGLAIIFLPFTSYLAKVVEKIIPDKPLSFFREKNARTIEIPYLDFHLISNPVLALDRVSMEITRSAKKSMHLFNQVVVTIIQKDKKTKPVLKKQKKEHINLIIEQEDNLVNTFYEIISYLQELNKKILGTNWSLTSIKFSMIVNELVHISKTVSQDLCKILLQKMNSNLEFSKIGARELQKLMKLLNASFLLSIEAFEKMNTQLAGKVLENSSKIERLENASRLSHITRLSKGKEKSIKTSDMHLNFLESIKRISTNVKAIAIHVQLSDTIYRYKKGKNKDKN